MGEFVFEPVRHGEIAAGVRRAAKRARRLSGEEGYEQLAAEAAALADRPLGERASAKVVLALAARTIAAAEREWRERHPSHLPLPRRLLRLLERYELRRAGGEFGYTLELADAFGQVHDGIPGMLAPSLDFAALHLIEAVVVANPKLAGRAPALHPPRAETRGRVQELFARVLSEEGAATFRELIAAETQEMFPLEVRRRLFGDAAAPQTPVAELIPEEALGALLHAVTDPRVFVGDELVESALRAAVWLVDLAELGPESQLTGQIRDLAAAIDGSGLAEQPLLVRRGWQLERARDHAIDTVEAVGRLARGDPNGRAYVDAGATPVVRSLALVLWSGQHPPSDPPTPTHRWRRGRYSGRSERR